jgi:hypothetical protein
MPDELALVTAQTEFRTAVPVYEGQLVNRYDHRAGTYEGFARDNKYGRSPGIPDPTDEQKAEPAFEIEPRYWMLSDVALARLGATVGKKVLVGFRNVGAPWVNQRSARGAILPRYAATDGLPVFGVPIERVFEFLAIFNSCSFDFLARGHMPGANFKLAWMLSQIAAPSPGLDPRISAHARKLSLTSFAVARLFDAEPHGWNREERGNLDVAVDAMVAHAYGLTKQQYEVILDSFEVMAREQTRMHGRYKFKADCLEAYDRV